MYRVQLHLIRTTYARHEFRQWYILQSIQVHYTYVLYTKKCLYISSNHAYKQCKGGQSGRKTSFYFFRYEHILHRIVIVEKPVETRSLQLTIAYLQRMSIRLKGLHEHTIYISHICTIQSLFASPSEVS